MAVPSVPWIYCPICKSFYTSVSKFNARYSRHRHVTSMAQLDAGSKQKMNELFSTFDWKEIANKPLYESDEVDAIIICMNYLTFSDANVTNFYHQK